MNQLQKSLLFNAVFSGITGILLVGIPQAISEIFSVSNTTVFWVLGIGLLLFAATLIFTIKTQNPLGVLVIIIMDYLWVLGSIVILAFQPFAISTVGGGIIAAVALVVLLIAINQAKALAKVDSKAQGLKQMTFSRIIDAPRQKTWEAISDVANYHEVAPNIDNVEMVSGQGEGMVRKCSHGSDSWTETCTLWDEGNAFHFEVNTGAPDYPYPFDYLKGHWKLEQMRDSRTKIILIFVFRYRRKFQNWLIHPILRVKFGKTVEQLLNNWQDQMEAN